MSDHERKRLVQEIRREVCEELAALAAVLFERLAATLDRYLDGEETPAAEPEEMDAFTGDTAEAS